MRGQGGAAGGVNLGGAAVEARLDGGLEARRRSVERRRRSVASGQGKSERVRGKDQGEPPGSGARERKERRALSWPGHGGGEVAAARRFWAAWRACGRAAEQFGWRWGASKRRVEASATQEGARGRPRAAGGAATRRRQQKQRRRLEVEDRDLNVISRISGT